MTLSAISSRRSPSGASPAAAFAGPRDDLLRLVPDDYTFCVVVQNLRDLAKSDERIRRFSRRLTKSPLSQGVPGFAGGEEVPGDGRRASSRNWASRRSSSGTTSSATPRCSSIARAPRARRTRRTGCSWSTPATRSSGPARRSHQRIADQGRRDEGRRIGRRRRERYFRRVKAVETEKADYLRHSRPSTGLLRPTRSSLKTMLAGARPPRQGRAADRPANEAARRRRASRSSA